MKWRMDPEQKELIILETLPDARWHGARTPLSFSATFCFSGRGWHLQDARHCLVGTFAFTAYRGLLGAKFPGSHVNTWIGYCSVPGDSLAVVEDERPSVEGGPEEGDLTFERRWTVNRETDPPRIRTRRAAGWDVPWSEPRSGPVGPEPLPALGTHGQLLRYSTTLFYDPCRP
jgi:hypothetical protein